MLNTKSGVINTVTTLIQASAIAGLAAVIFLIGTQALTAYHQSIELNARHACAMDYRLEFVDTKTNTTVIQPVADLYQKCLAEKQLQ